MQVLLQAKGISVASSCSSTAVEAGLRVSLEPLTDVAVLESLWKALAPLCEHSFFNSWSWIGCWLECLPETIRPLVLRVEQAGQLLGLGLFVPRKVRRRGVVRSRVLCLHEVGDPDCDALRIEHNGLLVQRGREEVVARGVVAYLDRAPAWDEIFLSGMAADNALLGTAAAAASSARLVIESREPSLFVDLEALRRDGADYLSRLSGNTRSQIRRSMREYETRGPLTIVAAASVEEAESYLGELARLHQQLWTSRGEAGAFAGEFFSRFHRTLVRQCFAAGNIQLLRIAAGEATIGYLYNFVSGGHIAFYQSGFAYDENPKLKPGLVSHTLAIELNRQLGHRVYDFLASEAQYKRSLATDSQEMVWAVLQRPRLQFDLERRLRQLKRQMVGRTDGETSL
ncbi:MAG: GNAT family N-acetyltransferase [Pirellulales bacterium]|nr:GNAT family N-acetyltransferase [Pirellulales bacterium]